MPTRPPALVVRRMIVDGELSLDLVLDKGLNVLATPADDPQRTNKAGKTGLVELIQYGLGRSVKSRERFHFAPIQGLINTMWLEITCNDRPLTIRRSLQQHTAGVTVFPVPFSAELREAKGDTIDLSTFSDFLLSQLGIPGVSVSTKEGMLTPLSFPTLMRTFTLHQDDSFGAILDRVEPESRKADIIGLVTSIRPKEVYDLEVTRAATVTRAQTLERSFEAVRDFLAKHGISSLEAIEDRASNAQSALAEAIQARHLEQQRIRSQSADVQERPAETVEEEAANRHDEGLKPEGRVATLRNELLSVQERRSDLERQVLGFRQEAARMREFIASLQVDEAKSHRLHVSEFVLSTFDFEICPRCVQEITPDMRVRERYHRCSLCNRPLTMNSDVVPRTAPASDDLKQQLIEAGQLLEQATLDAAESERALAALNQKEEQLGRSLNQETTVYLSPVVDSLLGLSQRVGEREAELAEANRLLRQAQALSAMEVDLRTERERAYAADAALYNAQMAGSKRFSEFEDTYRSVLFDLDFPGIERVELDRLTLMPYLDGTLYLHSGAALRGLAVVAYHLALLRLSLKEATYFPRFLVIDSPAVGDLNLINHDRLLSYLAAIDKGAWNESANDHSTWQIILTTRRMVPELEPSVRMLVSADEGQMLLRPHLVSPPK
jgi:hypothetical protein